MNSRFTSVAYDVINKNEITFESKFFINLKSGNISLKADEISLKTKHLFVNGIDIVLYILNLRQQLRLLQRDIDKIVYRTDEQNDRIKRIEDYLNLT